MTVMTDKTITTEQFRGLHVPGKPLVFFNVWDAGGAEAVENTAPRQSQPVVDPSQMQTDSLMERILWWQQYRI